MFCRSLFVLFHLAIVLSVFLRFTDSDYPFGVFKLFFLKPFELKVSELSVLKMWASTARLYGHEKSQHK